MYVWVGVGVDRCEGVGVCVGEWACSGTGIGVRGVCMCVRSCVSAGVSCESECCEKSLEDVLRLSIMLLSPSFAGEGSLGCSLSSGGWIDMQGGLLFFFLCLPPTDCTLMGKV